MSAQATNKPETNTPAPAPTPKVNLFESIRRGTSAPKTNFDGSTAIDPNEKLEQLKGRVKQSIVFSAVVDGNSPSFFKLGEARTVELADVKFIEISRVESPKLISESTNLVDSAGQMVESTHINLIGDAIDPVTKEVLRTNVPLVGGYLTQGIIRAGIGAGKTGLITTWQNNSGRGDKFKINALYYAKANDPLVAEYTPAEIEQFNAMNQRVLTDSIPATVKKLLYVQDTSNMSEIDEKIMDILSNLTTSENPAPKADGKTEEEKKLDDVPNMND